MRRLITCIIVTAALALTLSAQVASPVAPENAIQAFDERLGPDDGAVAALLIGGNLRGNLDLCDCNHPRGGLARRVGYAEAFKRKFKDVPILQVDAGFLFYNSTGYPRFAMVQNEQVAKAFSRWPLDVVNLSRFDLIYAQKLFASEGLAERAAELPILKNMISANGVWEPGVDPPRPFVVKEVSGPRIKSNRGKLRIAFVGLAEPIKMSEGMMDASVGDLFAAARKVVPLARKSADLVVIVAHSEWKAANRLASENPEADVVIAGDAEAFFEPLMVGKVLVIPAAPGNVREGDLRIYFGADGRLAPGGRATYKFRLTDLDAVVPADPAALAFTEAARQERSQRR